MKAKSILLYVSIWILWLAAMLWFSPLRAETRIAVIDTGLSAYKVSVKVCPNSEKNYVADESLHDARGHGTEVVNIISKTMPKNVDYCIIPIKVFDKAGNTVSSVISSAIRYAVAQKADIINMSLSGVGRNSGEELAVKFALDSNVLIVSAAGNDGINLNVYCNRFPVCYDSRQIVVGYFSPKSNKGKVVDIIADGNAIDSYALEDKNVVLQSGSSFAAPRVVAHVAANLQLFKSKLKENSNKGDLK